MKTILLSAFTLLSGCFQAQSTLTVVDKTTLQPIEGVTISVSNTNGTTTVLGKTNEIGRAIVASQSATSLITYDAPSYTKISITFENAVQGAVELTKTFNSLEDVIISGTRLEEMKKHIAQPIQVIKASDIVFQQQSTVPDILQNNGNIFMQKSQLGGGSPIIRGFETNKVLLVVDGVRMNNAIYRGGHLQNALTIDGGMLDKIEVVYGPSSVMYGSDALGGVMHFVTKKPVLSLTDKVLVKANAYTRYQSAANAFQGNVNINVANKNVASLTSFSYSMFNDLRQGAKTDKYDTASWNRNWYAQRINDKDSMVMQNDSNVQTGSGYTQMDFLQKLLFKQSDKVHHLVNFQYSTSGDVPRYDRLSILSGTKPKFAEWYYGPQNRLMLSYQLQLTGKTKLYDAGNITAAYQHVSESRISRRFNKNDKIANFEDVYAYSINADFHKKLGKLELNYGAEAVNNDVLSTATSTNISTGIESKAATRYSDGGTQYNSKATYIATVYKLTDKVILNAGVRASQVTLRAKQIDTTFYAVRLPNNTIKQNFKSVTGNIGVVILPTRNTKIYSLISTGFRAPNVDDLSRIFETTVGNIIVPNFNLKPEATVNGEIGFSARINNIVNFSTSAYYTRYLNAITLGNGTLNGLDSILLPGTAILSQVQYNTNALKAYIGGIESSITVKPITGIDITSTITYTRGRIMSGAAWGTPLDHIPPLFGRTSVSYTMKKLRVELGSAYSHWKRISDYRLNAEDNEDNATAAGMPAWATFNFRAAYQFNKVVGIQAAVENITDVRYRTFASNIGASGRNFIVTLRGTF
jgi:hemoglobin/transferrin/lactoferrin receptor protein